MAEAEGEAEAAEAEVAATEEEAAAVMEFLLVDWSISSPCKEERWRGTGGAGGKMENTEGGPDSVETDWGFSDIARETGAGVFCLLRS